MLRTTTPNADRAYRAQRAATIASGVAHVDEGQGRLPVLLA